jgi:hypothetical protein
MDQILQKKTINRTSFHPQNYKKFDAQKTIDRLLEDNWLQETDNKDELTLGIRSLLELRPYIADNISEDCECKICMEYVLLVTIFLKFNFFFLI